MRINKFIAQTGFCSRRKAEEYILAGQVTVNAKVISELGTQVEESDEVCIDGKPITPSSTLEYIAYNKPMDCLCSKTDTHGRKTIYDILPERFQTLNYVGRLDQNSHGILLLTNDGELLNRLTHPSYNIPKTYVVQLNKDFNVESAKKLRNGMILEDGEKTRPAEVSYQGREVQLILREGKKREIRRMMQTLKFHVVDLQRIAFANINLRTIASGKFRSLTRQEIQELYEMVHLSP